MRRGYIATGVIAALALPGLGLGLGLGLTTSAGAATAHAAGAGAAAAAVKTPRYVVLDCESRAQVKPGTYVLTCADAGIGLQNLRWTSWTPKLASGYGTEWENDCQPNCAAGHFHYYPVVAVLWGSGGVQGHPAERRYTEVTLIYPGARPPVYQLVNGKVVTTYPVTQTLPAR
jgi:hypothetical protein